MTDPVTRATAEARLIQSCTIRRRGVDTFDPDDGITAVPGALAYSGACLLKPAPNPGRTSSGGDDQVHEQRALLLPAGATGIRVTDVATIDGSRYVVAAVDDRPEAHVTLRTYKVVANVDAEAVPR